MSPYEYFKEMSPIFCNSDVKFKDWGTEMKRYCMSHFHQTLQIRIGCLLGDVC